MHKTIQKFISILLCLVICFSTFTMIPFSNAHAVGEAQAVEASIMLVEYILATLGVTFATSEDKYEASRAFVNDVTNSSVISGVQAGIDVQTGLSNAKLNLAANANVWSNFLVLVDSVKDYFSRLASKISFNDNSGFNFEGIEVLKIPVGSTVNYNDLPYEQTYTKTLTYNGVDYKYTWDRYIADSSTCWFLMKCNGTICANSESPKYNYSAFDQYEYHMRWGFAYNIYNGVESIRPVTAGYAKNKTTGVVTYSNSVPFYYVANTASGVFLTGTDGLIPNTANIDYDYSIDYDDLEFKQALEDTYASGRYDKIALDETYDDYVKGKADSEEKDEQEKVGYVPDLSWAKVWDDLGIKELVQSLTKADPDLPFKPSVSGIPNILPVWSHVTSFVSNTLLWMILWYNGFLQLPSALQNALWAILVLIILTGLLGVFLK